MLDTDEVDKSELDANSFVKPTESLPVQDGRTDNCAIR